MSAHSGKAKELFCSGYSCSQSVLLAFSDVTGLDDSTALKIASSFGGGMGRLREVCGAVTGAFMVLGLLYGYTSPADAAGKKEHYELIRSVAGEFTRLNGSIVCRELLGGANVANADASYVRDIKYYKKRPCAELCEQMAEVVDRIIEGRRN